jgi:hypothetical protein
MQASADFKTAIGVSIAAVIVFAAAFMPWGEITTTISAGMNMNSPFGNGSPMGGDSPFGDNSPFGGSAVASQQVTVTMTGWNGHLNLGGLKIPNWIVVLVAAGLVALAWVRATAVWPAPAALLLPLAGYGAAHGCVLAIMLIVGEKSSAGIGSLLTGAAFIAMLILFMFQAVSAQETAGRSQNRASSDAPASAEDDTQSDEAR